MAASNGWLLLRWYDPRDEPLNITGDCNERVLQMNLLVPIDSPTGAMEECEMDYSVHPEGVIVERWWCTIAPDTRNWNSSMQLYGVEDDVLE